VKIVEDKKHLNEDQLIPEVLSFLVALNYQLSALLEWSLWYLSASEENVQRLKKEADKWNHKHQKAQEAVLIYQEILRLCPPCYFSIYQLKTPWESLEKSQNLSKDTYVFLSPWVIHRQSRIYAQPERFWPARWLGNLKMNLSKTSFAPFGFEGKESLGEQWIGELLPRLLCAIVGTFQMQRVQSNPQNAKPSVEVQDMQNLKIQYSLSMALRAKTLPLDLNHIHQ
jgi:cytochrome P450